MVDSQTDISAGVSALKFEIQGNGEKKSVRVNKNNSFVLSV